MEEMEVTVTKEETLTFYPKEELGGVASVSIGHGYLGYKVSFDFDSDEDALACYNALLKVKEMDLG